MSLTPTHHVVRHCQTVALAPHSQAQERVKTLYMLGRHDEACEMYDWAFSRWPKPGRELLSNMGVCTLR